MYPGTRYYRSEPWPDLSCLFEIRPPSPVRLVPGYCFSRYPVSYLPSGVWPRVNGTYGTASQIKTNNVMDCRAMGRSVVIQSHDEELTGVHLIIGSALSHWLSVLIAEENVGQAVGQAVHGRNVPLLHSCVGGVVLLAAECWSSCKESCVN
eukprot:612493-Rhodomonas_salina.2